MVGTYDSVISFNNVNVEGKDRTLLAVEEEDSEVGVPIYDTVNVATNAFASDVYKIIKSSEGSILSCPVSLEIILACTSLGARDSTRSQIRNTLHIPNNDDFVKSSYYGLIESLNSSSLVIVSHLFIDKDFAIKESFISDAVKYFNSGIESVDLTTNPKAAIDNINKFVEEKSNKTIKQVLETGSIDQTTKCLLVNAVYFLGEWINKFNKEFTRSSDFYVTADKVKDVEFMNQVANFMYKDDDVIGAQIVELPYMNNEFKMVIILPHEGTLLKDVEDKFLKLEAINPTNVEGLELTKLDITIPKFKIEALIDFKEYLTKLGVKNLFKSANLDGISHERGLTVNKILQKVKIIVDEKGTEAVAASSSSVSQRRSLGKPPVLFRADHPFMFSLVLNETKIILFSVWLLLV